MAIHLSQLPDGTRFLLRRTGQKFRLLRRERVKGRLRHIVQLDGEVREGTLHHSCFVKPILTGVRVVAAVHSGTTP